MRIWKNPTNLEFLKTIGADCMPGHLGIEIVEVGNDYIKATMPVDHRTKQPMGLLHGGASAALSETIGSIAGVLILDDISKQTIVGIELNANHLKSTNSGNVYSITKAIKIGRTLQVWNTDIYDDKDRHLCTSRLTTMIIDRK